MRRSAVRLDMARRCRWEVSTTAVLILVALTGCGSSTQPTPATYVIGGQISGLATGTTAVLQNNGADDLAVNANGSFGFDTAIVSGATYEVTVKTQPTNPWQTCVVSNGTGTVTNAAVNTVSVACTNNQYAIGVSVSGLEGTGLVLQNNGGDDLMVTANGNSTFATHLASGTTYVVTVKTQPTSPIQTCTVTDGTGTMQGTDATNVQVSCRAGGIAQLIETDDAGDALSPQVAMDNSGNAVAVWNQSDGTLNSIGANRYVAGSGWGTAQLIETNSTQNADDPRVAMNGSGNAMAVWTHFDGVHQHIWANRYVIGNGWGTAQLIETNNTRDAFSPQVTMDASGNAIAVWYQFDGTRNNIWANRYVAGGVWGTAELIETDNAGGADSPQVAMDGSGNAMAVWRQSDGTRTNIWANRYVVGGAWGSAQLIETNSTQNAYSPRVAMDGSGNAMAVWTHTDGTRERIWANRYAAGSVWGTAGLIETDNTNSVLSSPEPQVAMDVSGNAVAVWHQPDGTRDNIWANRYAVGSGWGTAQLIETDNAGNARYPKVAMDASGNAVAVWDQSDGTRENIWANRYLAGGDWGTAQLMETNDVGYAISPQVAMDGSGNAMVVWCQFDGTHNNIWSNRY